MVQRKSFNHIPAQTARTLTGVRRMAVMLLMMLSTTITLYAETKLELTCVVVSDLAADANKVFQFKITLDDTTVNGTYGNMTFDDGVATVTLKGGESVSATDLAKDIGYTIDQYYDVDEFDLTTEGETGTISYNKSTATFTYTRKTSSGSQTTTYGLSTGTSEHGTLSLKVGDNDNATSAAEGAEVIVTVNAATGWQISGVTAEASTTWDQASARRRTGSTSDIPFANITPTKVDGTTNQWKFTMPPANVTVSATYKKVIQASWIQDITAVTYNGTGQTPTVTVKDGTTTLEKDVDYTVSYTNNVNAALSTATTNAPTVTITAVATSDKYAGTATKTFSISPKDVTVTAKSEAFTYDGTAHSNAGYDVEGLVGSDAISAVVEGSITFPRESPVTNTLKSYSFTTGTASNYSVTPVNGQLTMTNASVAITITAASQSWTYDGIAHTAPTVTLTSGALFTGDELVAEATGSVTDVADTQAGNNPVAFGYKVMHGTEDVTANYVITAVAGKLTVNQKSVTVTAQDKEFTYNGEAQTWNQYDVDGLVGSDQISAVVEGSITFPSQNPVANTIKSYNFTTGKPGNYSVTTANGQLTMTNASVAITITAASQSWTYDGNAHTAPTVTLTSGALFTGDELVAEATGSVTNVADTKADNNPVADGYKVMHGSEDVTANYVITAKAGTLTITEATINVTAKGWSGTYDGQKHSITVTIPADATIKYGINKGTYDLTTNPEYENAGEYEVFYQVTKDNYTPVKGSAKVIISKVSFNVSFPVKNMKKTCGDEPFTLALNSDLAGTASYSSSNTSVATVDENGTVTVHQAGSAKITGSVFVSNNYNTQEAYYWVEVKSKDIETSNGMNISWDGTKYIVEIKDVTNGEVVPDEVCEAHLTYTRMLNVSGKTTVSTDNNEESYLFTVCLPFKPQFNAKFYTLTNISDTSLEFTEIEGEAKALTPYLVSSQHNVAVKNRKTVVTVLNGEDSSVTAEEVDGMPFTNEEDMSFCDDIVEPTPVDGYQFRGTLRGLSNADAAAEGAFILQSDGTWGAVKAGNENVYIPPFRAYIVGASQNVRKLDSSISSAATGIERIVTIDRDGTERWYDLQGRRIEKPATKGIYIHNGMKVAVK